jgi:hypothetical protein
MLPNPAKRISAKQDENKPARSVQKRRSALADTHNATTMQSLSKTKHLKPKIKI